MRLNHPELVPKHTATELPGKWFVVVMEKVHALRRRDAGRVHVHRELQNVLEELKSNDFVHGDLRPDLNEQRSTLSYLLWTSHVERKRNEPGFVYCLRSFQELYS